jgi:hypothetical protein
MPPSVHEAQAARPGCGIGCGMMRAMTPLSILDLAPIVEGSDATHALDRKPDAALFPIVDACKTLAWSNAQTGAPGRTRRVVTKLRAVSSQRASRNLFGRAATRAVP